MGTEHVGGRGSTSTWKLTSGGFSYPSKIEKISAEFEDGGGNLKKREEKRKWSLDNGQMEN